MSKNMTVMVVDDDSIIVDCVVAFLEDEGFNTVTAESAEEALELFKTAPHPDVCITDLRLSGMNGEQFILAGRAIAPETGFLIHTGSAYILSDELVAAGLHQEDVLHKPIYDLEHLTECIESKARKSGV